MSIETFRRGADPNTAAAHETSDFNNVELFKINEPISNVWITDIP